MKTFLFVFAALIVLIPILFVLPLGFNRRGNMMIITVSFFLASFGLLAKSMFPFWQVALLLLLLTLSITYLLDKKLGHLIYASVEEQENDIDIDSDFSEPLATVKNREEKSVGEEMENNYKQQNEARIGVTSEEHELLASEDVLSSIESTGPHLEVKQQDDYHEDAKKMFPVSQYVQSVVHSANDDANTDDELEFDEEIQFLENRLQWLEESADSLSNNDKETGEINIINNLREIETWILEDGERENISEPLHEKVVTDLAYNEAFEDANWNKTNVPESEPSMEETSILMDDDFIPELQFEDDIEITVNKQNGIA